MRHIFIKISLKTHVKKIKGKKEKDEKITQGYFLLVYNSIRFLYKFSHTERFKNLAP